MSITGATVSFTIPSQDANEDAGNVSVCVTLVGVAGGLNRTVPYTITSGEYIIIIVTV